MSSCLVLFFLPDPGAAVRAWTDLLVAGGRLGVTTFGPQDPRWRQVDELFTPWLPPQMLDARASGRRGPFTSDDGVEQLLRYAGLVRDVVDRIGDVDGGLRLDQDVRITLGLRG